MFFVLHVQVEARTTQGTCSFCRPFSSSVTSMTSMTSTSTVREENRGRGSGCGRALRLEACGETTKRGISAPRSTTRADAKLSPLRREGNGQGIKAVDAKVEHTAAATEARRRPIFLLVVSPG